MYDNKIALVRGETFRSRSSGSITRSAVVSTRTGVAPAWTTALGTAMNVKAGTRTSSPGPTPQANKARRRAELHELTAMA
jgi:hypothetical protein